MPKGQNYDGRNTRVGRDYYNWFSNDMIKNLREKEVKFVIGNDNHNEYNIGGVSDAMEFIKDNGLKVHELVNCGLIS